MNLTRVSKRLSYLLRHSTDPLLVSLDGGWADVKTVVALLRRKWPAFRREDLETIVARDEKGRYSFDASGERIRANQGHSIPGVRLKMESPVPPRLLYHGTSSRALPLILAHGLLPMTRQYVHISPDPETARKVGQRHGTPVVLVIDAQRLVADGNTLMRSANGVWQAKKVPPEYLNVLKKTQWGK